MKYVLVRLVGDEATQKASALGDLLSQCVEPAARWEGQHPPVDEVARAVREVGNLVVIGHDGPVNNRHSLRSHANGGVWLDGTQLGQRFPGARIYLWACEAAGTDSTRQEGVAYLIDEAVHAGANAVAGYGLKASGDLGTYGHPDKPWLRGVLEVLVFGCLRGVNHASQLRIEARSRLSLQTELEWHDGGEAVWFQRQLAIDELVAHFHVAAASSGSV